MLPTIQDYGSMLNDTKHNTTNNTDTQSLGNDDDLHLKVSVLVTNGNHTLIDMKAITDCPFAMKKECLIGAATDFRSLMTMLFLDPACTELRCILNERYQKLCDIEAELHPPATPEYTAVTPYLAPAPSALKPVTPEMPPKPTIGVPDLNLDFLRTPGAMRKVA